MLHQLVAARLLGEATVVGCTLYNITSDAGTRMEALEKHIRESEHTHTKKKRSTLLGHR